MSLLKDYRSKYPAYKDVSDEDLSIALHQKYYSDIPYDEFSSKVGVKAEASIISKAADAVKGAGKSFLSDRLSDVVEVAKVFDNRSVTNNFDRSLDGSTAEETGFDVSRGGEKLKEMSGNKPDDLKSGAKIVDGASGIAEIGLRKGYAGLGRIEAGLLGLAGDITDSETLKNTSKDQLKYADDIENAAVLRGTKSKLFEPDALMQEAPQIATEAIGSVITSTPAMLLGGIPAIGATSALSDYADTGDKLNMAGKAAHAVGSGAAEALGEKLGGMDKVSDAITNALGGKSNLINLGTSLLTSGAKEIPSEIVTTTAQFLLDQNKLLGLNQDATLDDYIEQVKHTAKVAAMQGAGMSAAGSIARNTYDALGDKDRIVISKGSEIADAETSAKLQAQYEAEQKQSTANVAITNITNPDISIEDSIQLANTAIDTPLNTTTTDSTGLLASANQAIEAIDAADILGDSNVSNQNDAIAEMVAGTSNVASDNVQGSVADLPVLADGTGLGEVAEAPTSSIGSNLPNGNEAGGDVAVEGRPFATATDDFLPKMRNMTTDDRVKAQIDEELKLRGIEVNANTEIAGEKINKEWTAFSPDSGTLNIPRAEMPQIKAEHRGAMVNFLNARDISHEQDTVPASSLKPTQQEFSESKVKKAQDYEGGNRSILVSSDNHVLDGHHQWLAKLQSGESVDVIRLNAPIKELLTSVAEFPSAETAKGVDVAVVNVEQDLQKSVEQNKETLQAMLPRLNWAVVGNKRIDDAEGNQVGRTKHVPMDDALEEIRKLGALSYNGMQNAVNKALKGLPLSKQEKRSVDMLVQHAVDNPNAYSPVSDEGAARIAKVRESEGPTVSFDELFYGEDTAEAKQAVTELSDDDLFEGAGRVLSDAEVEALFNIGGTSNEQETDRGRVQTQVSGNDTTQENVSQAQNDESSQGAERTGQDLLGEDTRTKQAIADAERSKDAKRNAGNDNQDSFTLTGSNSEADKASAAGAQDLFSQPAKKETKTTYLNDRLVGENDSGQELFEKPDGVRYYKEDGIKVNEAARVAPDGSYLPSRNRDSFLTNEERSSKNKSNESGTKLSELKDLRAKLSEQLQAQGRITDARLEDRLKQVNDAISESENKDSVDADKKKAQDDLDSALGDLGDIFGKSYRKNITQEQEQKLIPVLTRVFDAAFRLGYYEFKDAAKFVIDTIRSKIGADVAETVNIDQLQGAYISMAGKYGAKATNKRDVVNVESIKEILEGVQDARPNQTEEIQSGRAQSDLLTEQSGSGNSKPMDVGVGTASESANAGGNISSGVSKASGNRTQGPSGSNRNESPSGSRETSNDGNSTSTTNGVSDFEITDETGIGEGSIAQKYKDNITAIKLIKTLESENRVATPDERSQLAKYNGFGALSKVFEKNNPKYQDLKDLLTEAEYEAARASILNAYYTSPTIVKAMYEAVAHMGFKGGRILEPSLGSGNFFGMMPASMRNKSKLNGVELDIITSRLAKYLYPNANISVATGFEEYKAPQGYFDLVISNPPFGSEQLRDSDRADYSGFSIHNFFIAKSIDKLREDGLMAVVVSHSFMDAMDSKAREWISKRAILRGAIRLPNSAFKDNAGTEVITDILFFQKTSMPGSNPDWVTSADHGDYFFNDYFSANPMNVLGRVKDITNQYGMTYTVEPTGDMAKLIKEFITARLSPSVYVEPENRIEVLDSADSTVPDGVKVGTFYTDDKGIVRQRLPDMLGVKHSLAWEVPSAKAQERMLGMMALRDLLRSQMRLERDPMATAAAIERNRKNLNLRYDAYLKEFGYLNSMTNSRLFLDDTESALLQALEIDYDQGVTAAKALTTGMDKKEASAQKADIFTRRVLFPPSDSITVNNAKDALLASLNVKGVVDVDYMAEVYGKSKEEIISELGEVVYNDPNRGFVTADEYLSGDVKTKLVEAKSYAKDNAEFNRNVEALEKVIPKDKMPSEIYASAGANWIPADVYADFASEITGIPKEGVEFKYISAAATWLSEKTRGGDAGKMTSDYGTQDINSFDMFALLINGKAPEVREMIGSGSDRRSVVNIEKTEAARSKLDKVKETWNSWIFKDSDRADRLATIYNDKHNRIVARKFDGTHMQFYGMSPSVSLRQHQKDVVWRAIQDRNVLLDHVVGAGKTMAAAAIAMEMKRLGIARKPLFVVPNHLTLQWRSEFTKLYPASNILAATPDDFAKDKREKLFSKMVTGNYDAIIIGHSSLTKIGLPADVEAKMYDEQVKEISDAIEAAKTERGDRGITRDMEKIKTNLEAKIKKLKEKAGVKDNVVSFDELGIDALVVDEMHEFKNLFFTTQMQRTAGLGNPAGSGKALDLFMKIKFMTETIGENVPLITMTGTPVSNSLAEMFTMQRFMKYKQMKRQDLHLFDAWAKQFGEVENVYEVAPSGVGYRQSTRFSKFKNLPALMGGYTGFADIITMQDLKDQTASQIDPQTGKAKVFPVPKLKTGKPINVIAQRSDLQRDFFGVPQLATNEQTGEIEFELDPENAIIEQNKDGKYQIIAQVKNDDGEVIGRQSVGNNFDTQEDAELELVTKSLSPKTFIDPASLLGKFANLAQLTRESKGKINALSLTGLASKAGLDYRIIDPSAPDFEGSKINQSVTNMVSLWKDTAKDKGAQIVFCDMSIPNSARNDMSSKERRIYVRDRDGELTHKAKGVVYAAEGYEGFPFYITKGRNGFDLYEAVSGTLVRDYGIADKAEAKEWIAKFVENESSRDRVFVMRDTKTIDQSEIEEYRDVKELEVADDGSNEISTADLEAVAGSSKFSVYDDIKTKLISRGVPENQIAFIHDYNTPKQKEELFKRVNSGDVRFLFGSTPKLGAGTNVQKRLVGLHHIDAPWRPSDLEQREGRIIRQGNDLYARDPENFEISIWRYATEQTYDTRRWQLLEHKAAGIEQLRKYSGESEIEDVASEASNSADMKAAASGNPLILEETKLRNEVKRLINLEKAHADSIYSMNVKVRNNANAINDYLPKKIAEYKQLKSGVESFPIPEDKTKIADIKIDGKAITSREAAENAIADIALKTRTLFTTGETPKVIMYRGIQFTVSRGFSLNSLMLRSPDGLMHTYGEKEGVSPSGLIMRFNNYIDGFDARIENANNSIEKAKIENESLGKRLNDPFEYGDKLKQTQAQHANIRRKLMKSSQLEAVPEEQRPEFDRLVKQRKETLKELGFDKALNESERSNDTPMFTRGIGGNQELSKATIQTAVNTLRKTWKNAPEIIVVQDMNDPAIREAVRAENDRQLSQGATGQPEGFFDAGKVYIVASEMNSPADVIRVVFHEALGHYGLRGLYGKELGAILDRVAMLRKGDMAKKAKEYGLDLNKTSDLRIIAEEVLAEMAQTAPSSSFVKSAIVAIRNFLRSIGVKLELSDNDIVMNYLIPARNFVVNGKAKEYGVGGLAAAFTRDNAPTVTQLFKELTLNDEMFKYAKSDATDMQEVFNDVTPQLVRVDLSIAPKGVDEQYVIYPRDKNGKAQLNQEGSINVYPGGKVEINVASWDEGYGGSGIYSAVANWAYNNGKLFAGDRDGITPTGKLRRLENMVSMALKFGTTDHIAPHPDQMRELNFDWKEGDTDYNIGQLLEASYNAIRNGVYVNEKRQGYEVTYKSPNAIGVDKLDDLVYDFDKEQFTDLSNGNNYTDKDFNALAKTARARATHAGSTTLKRAAIAHTFLRTKGTAQRERLLELIGQFSRKHLTGTQLEQVFYSRSKPQTNTTQFKAWFGDSKVVDEDGKPLIMYHGTTADFGTFKPNSRGAFFFARDFEEAERFADGAVEDSKGDTPLVMPVYLKANNIFDATNPEHRKIVGFNYVEGDSFGFDELERLSSKIKKAGFDAYYDTEYVSNLDFIDSSWPAIAVFSPNQIKSAVGNNGNFDANSNDILFSRSNPQSSLTPSWASPESSKIDSLVYTLQDKHIDLKRVTQAIKQVGVDISDRWNAYLQEELYHGRTAKRTQDFIKHDLEPLIEEMRMRGVAMADFEEYLWARHAEERNVQIAKVNPDMKDGGSGMTTQDANDYLNNLSPKDKKAYEALAKRIDLINRKSRQVLVDYGLESVSTITAWESAYKNYVPLMREDMDAGFGNGTGQGFSVKGNSSKRATGSNRAVVDIIANMAQQYEKNVIRGEKNRVSTALIGLAKLNPNEEFWQVDTPPTLKTISKSTGLVEVTTDPNYKNRDNVVVARIVNKLGKIEERSVIFNQFDERAMRMAASIKNLDQDQVGELLGVASSITRYFASINTQYNPIFGVINITRDVQGALLNLSTTQIADKKMDVLKNTPSALLGIYKDLRSERKSGSPAVSKWSTLFEEFQREGGQTGYRDMFKNAKERGEALRSALDPTWWKNSKVGKVISINGVIAEPEQWMFDKAIKPIFDWLSDYNNALENAVRLSVYKVALDNGQSKQQAASLAKNISVNFNRKGEMGRQIGSLYAFFNASVQGTARIGETLLSKDNSGKVSLSKTGQRIIQGGLLLGAMQALALAAAGYDDDEPPEFIRDKNIIIPLDLFGLDGKYTTIPMPLGFNAIPAFGRIVTEWALSGGEDTTKRLVHVVDMLLDVTNPIGNAGISMQTLTPTVFDPFAALAENKDFTGRPISREDFNSLNPTAGFTRSRDKAWDFSVAIARGINWATGGSDYKQGALSPTADQLEYLAGQFTGGVGREIIKAGTTADSLLTGEDLPTYKIPLVGRFYGDTTGQSSQGAKFYQNIRELNEHDNEIKGLREDGGNAAKYIADNPESRLSRRADVAMREVNSIRKRQRIMKENGASREAIKTLDDRITKIMQRLNESVVTAKQK